MFQFVAVFVAIIAVVSAQFGNLAGYQGVGIGGFQYNQPIALQRDPRADTGK